jgi:hypothetical protein
MTASSFVLALALSTAAGSELPSAPSAGPAITVAADTASVPAAQLDPRMRGQQLPDAWRYDIVERRPALLPAMYVTLGALNAMDVYSTRKAIGAGAYEANPLMREAAANTGTMLAVKAAATASAIYFTERTWKKNRTAAVIMAAALNGVTAAIVMRNLRNARR